MFSSKFGCLMNMFRACLALGLLLAATSASIAKAPENRPPPSITELLSELETIVKKHGMPGLSVAVVRHNQVELATGIGLADVATGRPATADTLFRVGSVSKNFVALAIMQLANEGKLDLMDPVRQWLPDVWFDNRWEATDPVRIVDLLEHTTGWDDIHFKDYAKSSKGMDLRQELEFAKDSRVSRWRPGTRFAYCNTGPVVAALIVERVSGLRFETYAQSHLFAPIGMTTATFLQPDPLKVTTLYHEDGKSPFPYADTIYKEQGALNASAKDMAAYLMFYLQRGGNVITSATITRIETPTRGFGAREGLLIGYGLYNYGTPNDGLVYRGHSGAINGATSNFAYLAGKGAGYFFSTNSENRSAKRAVEKTLRDYVSAGLARPTLPAKANLPADAANYVGWYEPASPRVQRDYFIERLAFLSKLDLTSDGVRLRSLALEELNLVPAGGRTLRNASDSVATSTLVAPNSDGQFVVMEGITMQRIPTWLAYVQIGLIAWMLLAFLAVLIYSPCWVIACLIKRRPQQDIALKLLPMLAGTCLLIFSFTWWLVEEDMLEQLSQLTPYSAVLWLSTVAFALLSLWCGHAFWTRRKAPLGRAFRTYAALTTSALLISTAYAAYWGVIGWRSWA